MNSTEIISFSDILSVNNDQIDRQHKKLISLVNDHIENIKMGPIESEIFAEFLSQLTDYSLQHFQDEEAYMEKHKFPELDEHRQEHEDFIEKVALFNYENQSNSPNLQKEVISYLRNFLVNHFLIVDMRYRDYILQR